MCLNEILHELLRLYADMKLSYVGNLTNIMSSINE